MIRVEILAQKRSALRPFVMLPFALYKDDPNWVAPLIRDQLRSLCRPSDGPRRFFLVYDGETPVARVMAGINERLNERLNRKYGYIGLFESAQRPDYARAALDAACAYLREEGMEKAIGPSAVGMDEFSKGLLACSTLTIPPITRTILKSAALSSTGTIWPISCGWTSSTPKRWRKSCPGRRSASASGWSMCI